MKVFQWTSARRMRVLLTSVLFLLIVMLFLRARAALLPFALGSMLSYIMLPMVNWLDARMRAAFHGRRITRSLAVLIVYGLVIILTIAAFALIIPLIVTEFSFLQRRLPTLARTVYNEAPAVVQEWLARYDSAVPQEIRQALERSVQDAVQTVISALQAGLLKTASVLFSTISFVLGLVIVPLWMFYFMRDQPEWQAHFYRAIPPNYREDVRHLLSLVDSVLASYLRGQLMLNLSVGIMTTVALEILGIDFALLLGTLSGLFETIPVLGPFLAAVPIILVALASAPDRLLAVIVVVVAIQQIENALLVPQITRGTVKLHPALAMIVLVVGSAVAGVLGVILSIPITAIVRDFARYLYLRLADTPMGPQEAFRSVRNRR